MRKLNPNLETWLHHFNKQLQQLKENGYKATSTNAREGLAGLTNDLVSESPEVKWVQDDLVTGGGFDVPVRIYHPEPENALPVLIYYHGGGHMAGSITVYEPIYRKLALATQHIIVAVDYRLSPECPYPQGFDDAYSVLKHIWPVLDNRNLKYKRQLSIAGDSGGGALTASVSAKAQFNPDVNINKQVLIYPSLDYTLSCPSVDENGTGYLLEKSKIAWYFDNYFAHNEDRKELSPLFMPKSGLLPKTLVLTAEFCPLRDEGAAYAKLVNEMGGQAKHYNFPDMIHCYLNMEDIVKEACEETYQRIADFLADPVAAPTIPAETATPA